MTGRYTAGAVDNRSVRQALIELRELRKKRDALPAELADTMNAAVYAAVIKLGRAGLGLPIEPTAPVQLDLFGSLAA